MNHMHYEAPYSSANRDGSLAGVYFLSSAIAQIMNAMKVILHLNYALCMQLFLALLSARLSEKD